MALRDEDAVVLLDEDTGEELERIDTEAPVAIVVASPPVVLAQNGTITAYRTDSGHFGETAWSQNYLGAGISLKTAEVGGRLITLALIKPRGGPPFIIALDRETGLRVASWDPPLTDADGFTFIFGHLVVWSTTDGKTAFIGLTDDASQWDVHTPGVTGVAPAMVMDDKAAAVTTSNTDPRLGVTFDLEFLGSGFTDFSDVEDIRIIRRLDGDVTNTWSEQGGVSENFNVAPDDPAVLINE